VGGIQPKENVEQTNSKQLRVEKLADLVGPTSMKTLNILDFYYCRILKNESSGG
jgi:hypothetical protein